MNSVAVLQARTNSSRLPGKALLPINGIPTAVLAAKRAANTGMDVIVATSNESTDDALASVLQQHDLKIFRGSLDNTLRRFVDALSEYDDKTIVFRLTADNVFPDGKLLDEIKQEFITQDLHYLCCNGMPSGLPYGVSVEVTRLSHLRRALLECTSLHDLEHVTPHIIRKFGEMYFKKYTSLNMGHFRSTIDCLDDYLSIHKVFSEFQNPLTVSFLDLIAHLPNTKYQPLGAMPVNKLVLGTAQLGLDYGIANLSGKPSYELSREIIKTAIANGVQFLDTANAYGDSENIIGTSLHDGWQGRIKIITKLSPLQDCPLNASPEIVTALVDASVFLSCTRLRVQRLDVVMLHRATHLADWNSAVWHRLTELKQRGFIDALGVSVQTPEELRMALAFESVSIIQMPFNILDPRWDEIIPEIIATKASRKLIIHTRSPLLQGLLLQKNYALWEKANIKNPDLILGWLQQQTNNHNFTNTASLCITYLNSLKWIDGIVLGMETMDQLLENIKIFNLPVLTDDDLTKILINRPQLSESNLNPTFWR